MIEREWLTMTRQHQGDGLIVLDTEGRVMLANPEGQDCLALLADAEVGDTLTYLGERSLAELLAAPLLGGGEIYLEIVHEGPPRQVFKVIIRSIGPGSQIKDWVIIVRMAKAQKLQTNSQSSDRPVLVVHWPPVSPMTSNIS